MTDRERLLEQVRLAEKRAEERGLCAEQWMRSIWHPESEHRTGAVAKEAAHHALTAMALRDLLPFAFVAEGSEYEET